MLHTSQGRRVRLLTLILTVLAIYLLLRWLYQKNPQKFTRITIYLFIVWVVCFLLVMAVTGRLHWLFVLLAGLLSLGPKYLPIIFRLFPFLKTLRSMFIGRRAQTRASPGQASSVQSRYFRMILNHDTGEISGTVTSGQFANRSLSELEIDDFKLLMREVQADRNSFELLNTYLQSRFGQDYFENFDFETYRSNGDKEAPGSVSPDEMTADQAREILGLDSTATRDDIISAHRRLMQKFHPDRGGSNYLAAQINRAKQILLNE